MDMIRLSLLAALTVVGAALGCHDETSSGANDLSASDSDAAPHAPDLLGGATDGTMMSGGDAAGTPAMVGVTNQVACDNLVCTAHAYCCYAPGAAQCLQGDGLNCLH